MKSTHIASEAVAFIRAHLGKKKPTDGRVRISICGGYQCTFLEVVNDEKWAGVQKIKFTVVGKIFPTMDHWEQDYCKNNRSSALCLEG